jgi:hypothetical protein
MALWQAFKDRLFGDQRAREDRAFLDTVGAAHGSTLAADIENGTNDSGLFPRDRPFEGLGNRRHPERKG